MTCMLCGSTRFEIVSDKVRYGIPRTVVRCSGCSLVSLEDPRESDIDYREQDYRRHHGPNLGHTSTAEELFNAYEPLQAERVERVGHLLSRNTVLEIGCSSGYFLHSIRNHVVSAAGIELEPQQAAFAREKYGLKVFSEPLGKAPIPESSFDVIFMFHVLEHLSDPLAFLRLCQRYLRPNGVLFLEVPNVDDALLTVYSLKEYRDFYYRLPHVYYFSPRTLTALLRTADYAGEIKLIQRYPLSNHFHWLLTRNPQPNVTEATSSYPEWTCETGWSDASNEIKEFFDKIDREYRVMLQHLAVTESMSFEGRPV